ncbi:hypothetical protein FB561_3640 [Kribbella amoyensis]|uniref:Uncharacterized protein n=1 Tax=Kribbella amoyensis TaxID=996641 RepID=A0A561BUH7_9ACTN|nr:hypothetical protein [Kribbella amoyensis]TWD82507.1 hypothetical protein FB561_3640 [Kribbella amoyensis]
MSPSTPSDQTRPEPAAAQPSRRRLLLGVPALAVATAVATTVTTQTAQAAPQAKPQVFECAADLLRGA